MKTTTERVFQIFKELNQIPRPSHHEEQVADYLCRFAERLNLPYKRDKVNINGGLGGHSGVDINKGRCSAVKVAWAILNAIRICSYSS